MAGREVQFELMMNWVFVFDPLGFLDRRATQLLAYAGGK
jgi:hypothetical protein